MESRAEVEQRLGIAGASYVDVAREVLGKGGSGLVFGMTMASSIGVCSAYIAFIGSTLSLISGQDGTLVHSLAPSWTPLQFEILAAAAITPVTMLRSFSFLSLTSKCNRQSTPSTRSLPGTQRSKLKSKRHWKSPSTHQSVQPTEHTQQSKPYTAHTAPERSTHHNAQLIFTPSPQSLQQEEVTLHQKHSQPSHMPHPHHRTQHRR